MSNRSKKVLTLFLTLFWASGCSSDKEQVTAPVEPISYHGDINLNGVSDELADAVLFSNYFVYGSAVFVVDQEKQIAATDVNKDGNPLTVSDLVYFASIVIGDALAKPKIDSLAASYVHKANGTVSVMDNVKVGAAFVVVNDYDDPILLADNMSMEYAYDGKNTRILVWSWPDHGESFTGDFLFVHNDVISIEMATYEGQPVKLEKSIPDWFDLGQNVPNPFDSMTTIFIILGHRAAVSLIITNTAELAVFKINQYYDAGVSELVWNGTDYTGRPLPNGIYNYSMIVEGQKKTKAMILQR